MDDFLGQPPIEDDSSKADIRMQLTDRSEVIIADINESDLISQLVVDSFVRLISARVMQSSKPMLIINCKTIVAVSSQLLGELVAMQGEWKQQGGGLALACVTPQVQEVFEVTKLNRRIGIFPTVDEALAYLIGN